MLRLQTQSGSPEYVDQFTIAISHNTDVTKLKHHTGLSQAENHRLSQLVIDHDGKRQGQASLWAPFDQLTKAYNLRPIFCLCPC